jgi:tetratricopeptide (TPR) repeat protein
MASQDSNNSEPNKPDRSKRFPDEKQRKRLQKLFEAASKQDSLEKYDYATELYADSLRGDPGNYEYLRCLMSVLHKRYVSAKKLGPMAAFKGRSEKAALKKAVAQCKWDEALQEGIDAVVANPWDATTLTQMATACGGIFKEEGLAAKGNFGTYGDCELYYLKCAYDTFPSAKPDIEVCIQLAEALKKRDRFLEAISFWHKVEVLRPDDELPKREIATLTVLLHQSRDTKFEGDHKKSIVSNTSGAKTEEVSHEERLAQRIKRNPNDIAAYDELTNLHLNADHYDKAIEVLNQKLAVTNNDVQVQEAIEDVHLKALRSKMIAADAKAKKSGKEADAKAFQAIRAELVEKELQTYRNRCARYPNNLAFRFELGRRYMLNGNIPEAIKELQVAKADPRKRGVCMMYLGDCFYQIKQYALAMTHYEHAIQDIPDRDQDNKKKSLFKAGKLALGLKDLVRADKFLTTLASMDYTYPRISEMLEHLKRMKDEADGKKPPEQKKQEPPKKRPEDEEEEDE